MVELPQGNVYLVVHDTKVGLEPPETPRIGVLSVSLKGILDYQSLAIVDWGPGQEPANDLEAVCSIPGRPNEYLAAESGYFMGRFGRVFHLQVIPVPGSRLFQGKVLGVFHPDPRPSDDFKTPSHLQFEGLVCLQRRDGLTLVFGRRGNASKQGLLNWGSLQLPSGKQGYRFQFEGQSDLTVEPGLRACADLLAESSDEGVRILSVAAADPGNAGPFRSRVYQAGIMRLDSGVEFEASDSPAVYWVFDGLKVEALARCRLPGASHCIGSDDEGYGGVWRPLLRPATLSPQL